MEHPAHSVPVSLLCLGVGGRVHPGSAISTLYTCISLVPHLQCCSLASDLTVMCIRH